MEEKKIKKKKLTLSIGSKKPHSAPHYAQTKGKTSVIIEKKAPKRWDERKFQVRDKNFDKTKKPGSFVSNKAPINNNFDIRKKAEERATKIFKGEKPAISQQKKGVLGKEKGDDCQD